MLREAGSSIASRAWLGVLVALATSHCSRLESGADVFGGGTGGVASAGSGTGGSSSAGATNAGTAGEVAGDGGDPGGGDAGAASDGCPALASRTEERLPAVAGADLELFGDTRWTCNKRYLLQGNVLVAPGATLTIDPGVTVFGAPESLLLVERGGRLEANGTADAPILFTSDRPPGSRQPGDFRGVVLAGNAPSHATNVPVYNTLEDRRAEYGGGPGGASTGSCGTLRFVRIEFAGGNLDEAALPGAALTLAGCGSDTVVDFVQVHRATDGIGILGGTVSVKHAVVTYNSVGNAFEWAGGYTGNVQFLIAQSLGASAAMLGSNAEADPEASPVSGPHIYNATLVGRAPLVAGDHFGVLLQFGSRLLLKNSIVQGFADAAFDLRLPAAVLQNDVGAAKPIDISNILMHGNNALYTPASSVLGMAVGMRLKDPILLTAADPKRPSFQPASDTVSIEIETPPPPFDVAASYRGALPPDGADWTAGWTAFPEN